MSDAKRMTLVIRLRHSNFVMKFPSFLCPPRGEDYCNYATIHQAVREARLPFPQQLEKNREMTTHGGLSVKSNFHTLHIFRRGKHFIFSFLGNQLIIEPNQSEAGAKSQQADVCPTNSRGKILFRLEVQCPVIGRDVGDLRLTLLPRLVPPGICSPRYVYSHMAN